MASRKAVDIARKILEEQNVDGGPSASKQASNVSSSRSQTKDDMEGVDVEPEQQVNGPESSSGDAASRLSKSVSDEERETRDDSDLSNEGELEPEGDDPYYTDNDFDKDGPKVVKSISEEDGDESNDEDEDEEDMGDEDGDDDETISDKMESVMNSSEIRRAMQEHVKTLFKGEDTLTEDYRERAATIFEAAVTERSKAVARILEEEFDRKVAVIREQVESEYEDQYNQLTEQVNNYLDYVVSEWMKENELQVESGLRNEITESFIDSLKNCFAEHYIDVPEERFDVLGELQEEIEETQTRLNESLSQLAEIRAENKRLMKEQVLAELSEGLVLTDKEKLRELSEGVSFDNTETFARKIKTLKESYFSDSTGSDSDEDTSITLSEAQKQINESVNTPNGDPEVQRIANAISNRFGSKFRSR